jgi:hypothetical protein
VGGEGGERVWECGSMNMVQILCTNVCKKKNDTIETMPAMRGGGNEEDWWGGEFVIL